MNGHFDIFLTHLVVFALGVCTWLPFTLWEGRRLTDRGEPVRRTHHEPRSLDSKNRSRVITVVIIVSALMIGLGIQQIMFQRDRDARDACSQRWGNDVIDTLETRVSSNDKVAKATQSRDEASTERDNAVDSVLLLVRALQRADPPPSEDIQRDRFERALQRFFIAKGKLVKAQDHLDDVIAAAEKTKDANPYPVLNCGGKR